MSTARFLSRRGSKLLVFFAVFCATVIGSTPAASASQRRRAPSVVLIRTASQPGNQRLEKAFLSELGLVLDEFRVVVRPRPRSDFQDLSLIRQVPVIRRLLGRNGAVAALWLGYGAGDLLLLNLVSVSTGRALVRIVESRARVGSAAKLALAARELLGTAYMFESTGRTKNKALARVVTTVRRKVSIPVKSGGRTFSVGAVGMVLVGIFGQRGPWIESGGGIRFGLHLVRGLWGQATFAGLVTDLGRAAVSGDFFGWRTAAGLGLMYGWRFGKVSFGPTMGLDVGASYSRLTLSSGVSASHFSPHVRFPVGFEVRWAAARHLVVTAGVEMGFRPRQEDFVLESNSRSVLTSPWLDGNLVLGLSFPTVP